MSSCMLTCLGAAWASLPCQEARLKRGLLFKDDYWHDAYCSNGRLGVGFCRRLMPLGPELKKAVQVMIGCSISKVFVPWFWGFV